MMSRLFFPPIYPILDDNLIPFEEIRGIAEELISGGAGIIQLRSKVFSAAKCLESACAIREATLKKGVLFIVNDRVDICMLSGADGVHLGQDDLPVPEVRAILGKDKIVGISTHNIEEASIAALQSVDYIAVGPVYATTTKQARIKPLGVSVLRKIRNMVELPLVAIGGIKEENCRELLATGVDSVAIISNILLSEDVKKKMQSLLSVASGWTDGS